MTLIALRSPIDCRSSPRYRQTELEDIEDQAHALPGWNQDCLQVSSGAFCCRLNEMHDGTLQIYRQDTNQATYQSSQPWRGALWFGISPAEHDQALWFNGRAVGARHVLFSPGDYPFTLRTPDDFTLFGMAFDPARLEACCRERFGRVLPRAWLHPGTQPLGPREHLRLCATLQNLLSATGECAAEAVRAELEAEIVHILLNAVGNARATDTLSRARLRHIDTVRRARALVLDPLEPAVTVEELCSRLYLTRRTLQNCFQEVMGMSPLQFVRTLRLNALRQDLRDHRFQHQSIQDIAARHGFWNLSYLTQDYKRLFGEPPSSTRQRCRERLQPVAG